MSRRYRYVTGQESVLGYVPESWQSLGPEKDLKVPVDAWNSQERQKTIEEGVEEQEHQAKEKLRSTLSTATTDAASRSLKRTWRESEKTNGPDAPEDERPLRWPRKAKETLYTVEQVGKSSDGHFHVVLGSDIDKSSGRFKILQLIGEGTFGKVVRAWDRKYRCVCAVKLVRATAKYSRDAKYEISRLKVITEKDPPDIQPIVKLQRWFSTESSAGNHVCIVFPIHGLSLSDSIRKAGRFRETEMPQLAEIIFRCSSALHYLHEQCGWIHSDLKPENILYEDFETVETPNSRPTNGKVRLIDLGGAVELNAGRSSRDPFIVTTRQYRAPEVIMGAGFDKMIDSWSLGAIIYELVFNRYLFKEKDVLETLHQHEAYCGEKMPKEWCVENSEWPDTEDCFTDDQELAPPVSRYSWAAESDFFHSLADPTKKTTIPTELAELLHNLLRISPSTRYTMVEVAKSSFIRQYLSEEVKKSEEYKRLCFELFGTQPREFELVSSGSSSDEEEEGESSSVETHSMSDGSESDMSSATSSKSNRKAVNPKPKAKPRPKPKPKAKSTKGKRK